MILDFTKLHNVLERIATALEGGAVATPSNDTEPSRRGRGRPAKGEAAPSPEQLAAAVAAAPAASTAATTSAAQAAVTSPAPAAERPVERVPTLQQVADAIIDLANNYSRDAAVAILTKYSVKKVPELKPEQFANVLADVAKAKAPTASSGLV